MLPHLPHVKDPNYSDVPDEEFLHELKERARRYGHEGDYVAVRDFVNSMFHLAGLRPGDLEPYPCQD